MRSFYTAPTGFTADLCKHLYKDSTRLIVRNPEGRDVFTHWYDTWDDAMNALKSMLPAAVNDLTHQPLT